ncbi:Apoptosis-stimulating of p53 protein 2 [Trichinella nativa]|uniref:Apoptosis-stimulating of p53 protein 2 n=1 Tax=Trichinella nativa TaxID=6335 RepID=A0A0V1LTR1_9BILA|nr:Apoptosis-stimulating of p53 protein 2 [Trichinella nativa]
MNGSLWKVEATSRMLLQANALKSRCMRRSIKPRSSRLGWSVSIVVLFPFFHTVNWVVEVNIDAMTGATVVQLICQRPTVSDTAKVVVWWSFGKLQLATASCATSKFNVDRTGTSNHRGRQLCSANGRRKGRAPNFHTVIGQPEMMHVTVVVQLPGKQVAEVPLLPDSTAADVIRQLKLNANLSDDYFLTADFDGYELLDLVYNFVFQILKKITTEPELSNRVKQLLLFVQTLLLCFMMNSNSICTHVTIEPVLHCNVYKSLRDTNKLFDAEERLYQLVKKHILGGGRKNDVQFYLRKKKTITSGLNTSASSSQSDGKNEALPEMYKTNPDFGDLFKMPVSQLRRIALHRRALIDQNCNTINEKNRKLNSFLTSSGVDLRLQQKLRQLEDRLALEEARFKKLTRLKEELNNYSLCYKSLVQQLDLLKMKMRNKKTEVELADQKVEELSRLLAKLKLQRILLAKRAEISLYDSEIGDLSCALSLPTTGSGSGADPGPSSGPGPDGQASSKLSVGSECSRVQGSRPKAAVEPFKIDTPDQDVECCSTEEAAAAESGSKLDQYVRSKGFRTAFFAMQRALVEDATGDGRSVELPSDSDDHDVVVVDGGQPPPSAGPTEPLVKFVHGNASRRSNVRSELADSSQSPPPDLIPASEKSKFLGQGALASASDAALGDIVKAETDKIHLRSDTLRAAKRRSWAEHHANLATSDETEHIRLLLCRELKKGKTSVNLSWILDQLDSVGAATTSTSTTNALLSEPMRSSLSPSDEHLNYCRAKVTSSTTNNDDDTKLTLDSLTAVCCPQISDKLLCDSVEIEKNGKDDKVEVKEQLLEQQPQENDDDDDDDDGGKEEEHEREEITIVVVDEEGPEIERRQRSGSGTTSTNRREAEPKPRRGILQGTSARCGDGPVRPRGVHFDPLALLLDAALEGELDLVKRCSKQLPNVSVCYEEGITALHNAICAGHYDIVRFLVEAGADVNAQDSDGWTPLHCAASCNNLPIVKFLVENGACIFASTLSDEETPAAKCEETEEGFVGCSQFLLGLQQRMGTMNGGIVYAAYSYDPERDDELGFEKDDQLRVLAKDLDGFSGWWRAFDPKSGREGYVPRNYLSLYPRPSQLRFTTRGGKNDQQEESRAKTAQ